MRLRRSGAIFAIVVGAASLQCSDDDPSGAIDAYVDAHRAWAQALCEHCDEQCDASTDNTSCYKRVLLERSDDISISSIECHTERFGAEADCAIESQCLGPCRRVDCDEPSVAQAVVEAQEVQCGGRVY